MYFKKDDIIFEIFVKGYTEDPEYYGGALGRNALSCQFDYQKSTEEFGILWDELFQTDDIVRLYNGIYDMLYEKNDSFSYADEWGYVKINARRLSSIKYELVVSVYDRSEDKDISEFFYLSTDDMKDFVDELRELTRRFPVVD